MRTFRETDVVGIGLRLFEQTGRIEVLLYPFTVPSGLKMSMTSRLYFSPIT